MKKTEGRKTEQGPMQNLIVATQVAYFQRTLFEIRNKAAILLLNLRLMLHSLDPKAHSCLILMGEYTRFVKAATHISDLLDFSIEECSSEELRRICQEAIARGEAQDRAKKLAWKRRFRRILLLVVIASSAGLCLRAVDFSAASRWRTSRVIISTGVLFGGGR
jgi:hypothetical protein